MKDVELFRILMMLEDSSITKSEAQEQILCLFGAIQSFCNDCGEVHWLYEDNLCERCLKNRIKKNNYFSISCKI